MRQIVLDTETTGLSPKQGHRVIEIGCVELIDRQITGRHFHTYLCPDRGIDPGAQRVHGITEAFLVDKPRFNEICDEFLAFCQGADIIIHNAPFDVGFLCAELDRVQSPQADFDEHFTIIDTLQMARKKHPGQKNNLDALCRRYEVDNTKRDLHGALLDAQILADLYLVMTGGQNRLSFEAEQAPDRNESIKAVVAPKLPTKVLQASAQALKAHQDYLASLEEEGNPVHWVDS